MSSSCKTILKSGKRNGELCGRTNCQYKSHIPNIFDYLGYQELTKTFAHISFDNKKIIEIFKEAKNLKTLRTCVEYLIEKNLWAREILEKLAYYIIIFILLDETDYNRLRYSTQKFNIVCQEKYDELMIYAERNHNSSICEFIRTNFEKGKRFFMKRNNKTYRHRIFRAQMRLVSFCSRVHEIAMEKHYLPGKGIGYFNALEDLNRISLEWVIKV